MIWLLLLLVPLVFSVGFLAGCWFSTGGRCRRGGYITPLSIYGAATSTNFPDASLEAQEFRPPYTGER